MRRHPDGGRGTGLQATAGIGSPAGFLAIQGERRGNPKNLRVLSALRGKTLPMNGNWVGLSWFEVQESTEEPKKISARSAVKSGL